VGLEGTPSVATTPSPGPHNPGPIHAAELTQQCVTRCIPRGPQAAAAYVTYVRPAGLPDHTSRRARPTVSTPAPPVCRCPALRGFRRTTSDQPQWRIYDFNHWATDENDIVSEHGHDIIRSLNDDKIVVISYMFLTFHNSNILIQVSS